MLKFGLLLVLANLCLKVLLGIGLWKMAMEYKNSDEPLKVSDKYNEEYIEEGNPDILRGQKPMGGSDQFGNNENEENYEDINK